MKDGMLLILNIITCLMAAIIAWFGEDLWYQDAAPLPTKQFRKNTIWKNTTLKSCLTLLLLLMWPCQLKATSH